MPNALDNVDGVGHPYDYPPANPEGEYAILDQYHSKPSKIRVACVGAGASGLCLAYKMERMLTPGSWELTLFEKNPHFGGTWYEVGYAQFKSIIDHNDRYENTYPGVACDIPSHDYNFTWDPKPDWKQFFASGKEIQGYFENFAERHGSKKYMQLNSKIIEAKWDDDEGTWSLTIEDTKTKENRKDWAHCLVNGTGKDWNMIGHLHSLTLPQGS